MADSDKELNTGIKEDRVHTHRMLQHTSVCLLAGVVKSIMNNQDADFASKRWRLEEKEGNKMLFQAVSIWPHIFLSSPNEIV